MATLIAAANGNWTTATTWQVVDATSLLDSQTGNFTLATAPTWSQGQAFTPGAITIDGLAIKVATRVATPSGTISVRLFNVTGGAAVAGTTVTINVSDLPASAGTASSAFDGCSVGWIFFKFASPVTLAAATNYRVEAQTSAASQVNVFRDATANNLARMLRTTTTAAPAAGDNLFVLGEWTAAGTRTDRTVTMDSTAATDYGGGSTSLAALGIGIGGTLAYGTAASTTYVLRLSGVLQVWAGGTFTIGTTGTPIPRTSTAVLEFDNAATGDFGLVVWGTFTVCGQSPTAGKEVIYTRLAANASSGATSLTVGDDTGWKAGQEITITSTTRNASETEVATLAADATATTLSLSAGLSAAHEGNVTDDIRAEVGLLSGHVSIRSVLSSAGAYVSVNGTATVSITWCLLRYVFGTANGKRGLEAKHSAGSLTVRYSIFRDQAATGNGIYLNSTATTATLFEHIVCYAAVQANYLVRATTSTTPLTVRDWVSTIDINGAAIHLELFGSGPVTLERLYLCGCGPALSIRFTGPGLLTLDTVHAHAGPTSGSAYNVLITSSSTDLPILRDPIRRLHCWRAGSYGLAIDTHTPDLTFEQCRFFGNFSGGVVINGSTARLRFRECRFAGQSSLAQPRGLVFFTALGHEQVRLEGCWFGSAAGAAYANHTTADVGAVAAPSCLSLILVNTVLGSPTRFETAFTDALRGYSYIAEQRRDGVSGDHRTWYPRVGMVRRETTVFRTAAPSERLDPTGGTNGWRLPSSVKRIPVSAGQTAAIGVYVRKTASYDGAQPRLVLRANAALGLLMDQVLDTMSAGADTWEQLTGTTPVASETGVFEVFVDCDGTAGSVYVDDWTAAVS
jgi:hypothetical protein